MKITIKKEFDGHCFVGNCDNIPGCFYQAEEKEALQEGLVKGLNIIRQNCSQRNQAFPTGKDTPLFDIRIRFDSLSTDQLVKFFESHNYHMEYIDPDCVLLLNSNFPFNRVFLPRRKHLSYLLVEKIFGVKNTVFIGRRRMKLNASVS